MADIIFPGQALEADLGQGWMPHNVDLKIWQGDKVDFNVAFTVEETGAPIPITTSTVQAVIKPTIGSTTSYSFTCTIVQNTTHKVRVYMPSSMTATIAPGSYVWNLQLTDSVGDVRTYMAGDVTVLAQVD